MGRLLVSGGSIIRKYGYILRYLYLCFQVCIPALRGNKKAGRGRGGVGEEEEWKVDQRILIKDLTR